ncbi:SRPBCC family protein [Longispora sp. NPDC051575]|uniref:SRPBCC family protein n=1 Tax=Longispora sp. NPDC051575 TaxID=3154943 RepID=UPI003414006C
MMIAQAEVTSPAAPSAFFDRWADMATWPEWNTDTDWVRLDGPFVPGATGVLKPKGGPKVRFVVAALVPDREFTDVSTLFGARLTFRHLVERTPAGTRVAVTVDLTGPLGRLWNLVLGKGIKASLQADLDRLAAVAAGRGADTARQGAA